MAELHEGFLEVLERAECLERMRTKAVGRVAFTDGALPAIRPVNYVMYGEAVVFRTNRESRLAAGTTDAVVAFEVDDLDEKQHVGWSVVVVGLAEEVTRESDLLRISQLGLAPWADGDRQRFVKIVPAYVTGRRIASNGQHAPSTAGEARRRLSDQLQRQ